MNTGVQIRKGDIKYSIVDYQNSIYGGDLSFSNAFSIDPEGSYNNIIGGYIWPYIKGYNSNLIVLHDVKWRSYDRYYSFIKSDRSYQNNTYYMDDIFLNISPIDRVIKR